MKRPGYLVRLFLFFCLLIPSPTNTGIFESILAMLGTGKGMSFIFSLAMAAFVAYRTTDVGRKVDVVGRKVDEVDRKVTAVHVAVEQRPTTAHVQTMITESDKKIIAHVDTSLATTNTKVEACATRVQVDERFDVQQQQLAAAQAQLTQTQTQITTGFEESGKNVEQLRKEVGEGLHKVGADVQGLQQLTEQELRKFQAVLKDQTGQQLKQLAFELDQRLANKEDVKAISAQLVPLQNDVHRIYEGMVSKEQIAAIQVAFDAELKKIQAHYKEYEAMQKKQEALQLLAFSSLCPVSAGLTAFDAAFTPAAADGTLGLIRANVGDQAKLRSALATVGVSEFANTTLTIMQADIKDIAAKLDAAPSAFTALTPSASPMYAGAHLLAQAPQPSGRKQVFPSTYHAMAPRPLLGAAQAGVVHTMGALPQVLPLMSNLGTVGKPKSSDASEERRLVTIT